MELRPQSKALSALICSTLLCSCRAFKHVKVLVGWALVSSDLPNYN